MLVSYQQHNSTAMCRQKSLSGALAKPFLFPSDSLPCAQLDSAGATLAVCIYQAPLIPVRVSQREHAILLNGQVLKGMQFPIKRARAFDFSFLIRQNSIFWCILYIVIYSISNSWAPTASKICWVWKIFCTSCFPSYRGSKYNKARGRKLFCTL